MKAEHRGHPRYRVKLDVEISGVVVHTTNVSMTGMQLVYPTRHIDKFNQAVTKSRVEVKVKVPQAITCRRRVASRT